MSEKIVQLSEEVIKGQIKELVRGVSFSYLYGNFRLVSSHVRVRPDYSRAAHDEPFRVGARTRPFCGVGRHRALISKNHDFRIAQVRLSAVSPAKRGAAAWSLHAAASLFL